MGGHVTLVVHGARKRGKQRGQFWRVAPAPNAAAACLSEKSPADARRALCLI